MSFLSLCRRNENCSVFSGSFYSSRDICSAYNNSFDVKECRAECSVDSKVLGKQIYCWILSLVFTPR